MRRIIEFLIKPRVDVPALLVLFAACIIFSVLDALGIYTPPLNISFLSIIVAFTLALMAIVSQVNRIASSTDWIRDLRYEFPGQSITGG